MLVFTGFPFVAGAVPNERNAETFGNTLWSWNTRLDSGLLRNPFPVPLKSFPIDAIARCIVEELVGLFRTAIKSPLVDVNIMLQSFALLYICL